MKGEKNKPLPLGEYYIKLYHGYGHTGDLLIYGHVFSGKPVPGNPYSNRVLVNIWYLLKLFMVKPQRGMELKLDWYGQELKAESAADGFIKFEWSSSFHLPAGWHEVKMDLLWQGRTLSSGKGVLFVPHVTQFGFISDIDDTVLVSHSATLWKRLKTLFTTNPRTRRVFEGAGEHYRLLAEAHTPPGMPNPFFYVSSSEWNLYDYLKDFFRYNELPEGVFLLSQIKRWYQLFRTGQTKHKAKLLRVMRILDTFPSQRFVLLGDNTQKDPDIYEEITRHYPERIHAIYIRNALSANASQALEKLTAIERKYSVHTCLFETSEEAISHSRSIGLID